MGNVVGVQGTVKRNYFAQLWFGAPQNWTIPTDALPEGYNLNMKQKQDRFKPRPTRPEARKALKEIAKEIIVDKRQLEWSEIEALIQEIYEVDPDIDLRDKRQIR